MSLLPAWITTRLIRWYFEGRPVHYGAVMATARLVNTYSVRNATNMANEEMQTVDVPDYHLLQRFVCVTWMIFSFCHSSDIVSIFSVFGHLIKFIFVTPLLMNVQTNTATLNMRIKQEFFLISISMNTASLQLISN